MTRTNQLLIALRHKQEIADLPSPFEVFKEAAFFLDYSPVQPIEGKPFSAGLAARVLPNQPGNFQKIGVTISNRGLK